MGLIQNLVKGMRGDKEEFKQKLKEVQEDTRIHNLVEERQKSSNRRELERHMRDQEEAEIERKLKIIRKQRDKETWRPEKTILSEKATMLKTDRPILKEKNIFVDNRNDVPLSKKGRMFFRW